jgi:hypothetical protein
MGYACKESIATAAKCILHTLGQEESGRHDFCSDNQGDSFAAAERLGINEADAEDAICSGSFDCAFWQLHDQGCLIGVSSVNPRDGGPDYSAEITPRGRDALAALNSLSFYGVAM